MPLVEDMERKGAWLFRWRGILPVLLIPGSLLVAFGDDMSPAFNDPRWIAICVGVGVLGQIIRALTIGYVPKGTSGRNTSEGQVAMVLNTKGMYSFVRHPLYLGNFFMWLGLVLYTGSFTLSICVSIAFWIYYTLISMTEERYLRGQFGDTYLKWSETIPAFFPKTLKWIKPGVFFSLRNVLKREYNGAFALVISFVAINAVHSLREGLAEGLPWIDALSPSQPWQASLSIASISFLLLRYMKKRTKVLDVEGREYIKESI